MFSPLRWVHRHLHSSVVHAFLLSLWSLLFYIRFRTAVSTCVSLMAECGKWGRGKFVQGNFSAYDWKLLQLQSLAKLYTWAIPAYDYLWLHRLSRLWGYNRFLFWTCLSIHQLLYLFIQKLFNLGFGHLCQTCSSCCTLIVHLHIQPSSLDPFRICLSTYSFSLLRSIQPFSKQN